MWSTWSESGNPSQVSMSHILQRYSTFSFARIVVSVLLLVLGGSETFSYASNLSLSCSVTAVFLSVV